MKEFVVKKTGERLPFAEDSLVCGVRNGEEVEFCISDIELVNEQMEIDWEQRRYEIAKEMLPISAKSVNASTQYWMKGMSYPEASATLAIRYADALIKELKKGTENGSIQKCDRI